MEEPPTGDDDLLVPTDVRVLILAFEFNDLDLGVEIQNVRTCFERLGYRVTNYMIPMVESSDFLQERLETFFNPQDGHEHDGHEVEAPRILHIIHYMGHAESIPTTRGPALKLVSHNIPDKPALLCETILNVWNNTHVDEVAGIFDILRERRNPFQPVATIPWKQIRDMAMRTCIDTLFILDCSDAGVAAVTPEEDEEDEEDEETPRNESRKELIGAGGWGLDTRDRMSQALCRALENELPAVGDDLSTHTLIRRMNNILYDWYAGDGTVRQAVHYLLKRTGRPKMVIPHLGHGDDVAD